MFFNVICKYTPCKVHVSTISTLAQNQSNVHEFIVTKHKHFHFAGGT